MPVVATEDGGPTDILKQCRNGALVDPLDSSAIAKALLKLLSDAGSWREKAANGLQGVHRHYSWEAHASRYEENMVNLIKAWREEFKAPNAPWVEVWLSPQTIVVPGRVNPCSGPTTCTMPWRSSSSW